MGNVRFMLLVAVGAVLFLALALTVRWATRPTVAHDSTWLHDYDTAVERASATGKPMFVYFGADWCPPCVQMHRNVFSKQDVMKRLKARYVLVEMDLTTSTGPSAEVAQQFGVRNLPTMMVLTPDEQVRDRRIGFTPAAALLQWLTPEADASVDDQQPSATQPATAPQP